MPWLAAPGHCVALSDASVHRVPLPNGVDVDGIVCCGSLGNWIALAPKRRRWRPRHQVRPLLLNPFSGASVQLPILTPAAFRGGGDDINVEKIVISSAPDSDGCVVAAIVMGSYSSTREIVIWRRGQESWSTPAAAAPSNVADAVFHGGDLYVVDKCSQLYVFSGDDGGGGQELHPVRLEMDLTRTGRFVARVLLECDGRLLMADRHRHGGDAGYHEYSVYALERDAACGDWRWSPVTRLDGHAARRPRPLPRRRLLQGSPGDRARQGEGRQRRLPRRQRGDHGRGHRRRPETPGEIFPDQEKHGRAGFQRDGHFPAAAAAAAGLHRRRQAWQGEGISALDLEGSKI
uniref:KIB1-4 beta-propeller domain-containing protein n=1 Tax=Oryza glumipatula TaxID=40148 RepID=A0A0E0AU59_9ORYZ